MIILQILIGLIAVIITIAAVWGMLYGIGRLVFPLLVLIGLQDKYDDLDWSDHLLNGLLFLFLIAGIFFIIIVCIALGGELLKLIIWKKETKS